MTTKTPHRTDYCTHGGKPDRVVLTTTKSRILGLTGREIDMLTAALAHEWSVLQIKLTEYAAGDDNASSRLLRRRVEELDVLTAKLGGKP